MAELRPTLSIVVPVYRGAESVGQLVEALSGLEVDGGLEIVLVNDGSPDNSLDVCKDLVATAKVPITLVNLSRNFGEHNAVMAGLRHARGRWIITMDDDLQNPPSEVIKLLDHARNNGYDAVYTYYDSKEHAAWRNWGSQFTNWVADILLDKPKNLYLSSFRCVSAFVAEQAVRYEGPFPYVDGLIMQVTQNVGRIKVEHLPRALGRSNYTLRRLIRLWLNMFLNFSVMPLRISTLTGLLLSFCGFVGTIAVAAEALITHTPPGWGSLMVTVLLVSGVQLVIVGLVGEYLGRLYLTVNRKPQTIVREVFRSEDAIRSAPPAARRAT
ncbi:MAG: glycosyltransferase family 2 protein [Alphaproteobacteria bacterium]|nr:glycosyltransferase family 2 protein [Alphaproteobacteria bacterium]